MRIIAFVEEDGVQYAYCTYTDVTELKESRQQTQAMYEELNKELNALSNASRGVSALSNIPLLPVKNAVRSVRCGRHSYV